LVSFLGITDIPVSFRTGQNPLEDLAGNVACTGKIVNLYKQVFEKYFREA
jgi:hypothetical protein